MTDFERPNLEVQTTPRAEAGVDPRAIDVTTEYIERFGELGDFTTRIDGLRLQDPERTVHYEWYSNDCDYGRYDAQVTLDKPVPVGAVRGGENHVVFELPQYGRELHYALDAIPEGLRLWQVAEDEASEVTLEAEQQFMKEKIMQWLEGEPCISDVPIELLAGDSVDIYADMARPLEKPVNVHEFRSRVKPLERFNIAALSVRRDELTQQLSVRLHSTRYGLANGSMTDWVGLEDIRFRIEERAEEKELRQITATAYNLLTVLEAGLPDYQPVDERLGRLRTLLDETEGDVYYRLATDREMPYQLARLNDAGVPDASVVRFSPSIGADYIKADDIIRHGKGRGSIWVVDRSTGLCTPLTHSDFRAEADYGRVLREL